MSEREQMMVKAILRFLERLQGKQAIETILHAAAQTEFRNAGEAAPSLKEFEAVLMVCDKNGWLIGVASKVTKQMKWSLSDAGQAALMELQ